MLFPNYCIFSGSAGAFEWSVSVSYTVAEDE